MRITKIAVCLLMLIGLLMLCSHKVAKASEHSPASVATYTGTIVTSFTITIDSTGLPTTKMACVVQTALTDSGNSFKELAESNATVSGSTATCTVKLPYSWTLSDASTDTISIEYDVVTPTTLPTTNASPGRYSRRTFSIAVPANGATTDETIDVTI
jgi:hypothetical protein